MSEDLARRLAEDLKGSFELVVRRYQHALFTAGLRWSACAQEAEEVAQEAFVRAYEALSTYAPKRIAELRLRPWLLKIALNVFRDELKRMRRRPGADSIDDGTSLADPGEGPAEASERRETGRGLVVLLNGLPDRYRVPVVLRHVLGLSYEEISEVLECPTGTAKAQVSRGLEMLREKAVVFQEVRV